MIEKRLIQWYASDAGVDLDVAEREVVLTYVLRILADAGNRVCLPQRGHESARLKRQERQPRYRTALRFRIGIEDRMRYARRRAR